MTPEGSHWVITGEKLRMLSANAEQLKSFNAVLCIGYVHAVTSQLRHVSLVTLALWLLATAQQGRLA